MATEKFDPKDDPVLPGASSVANGELSEADKALAEMGYKPVSHRRVLFLLLSSWAMSEPLRPTSAAILRRLPRKQVEGEEKKRKPNEKRRKKKKKKRQSTDHASM
jgi:hypothetical protein